MYATLTQEVCTDPYDDNTLDLTRLDQQLDAELDRLAELSADRAEYEEPPSPEDDDLETPDEGVVYVNSDSVFTGTSDVYEIQIVLPRSEFKRLVKQQVADLGSWKLVRRHGERSFNWVKRVLVAFEGNAD